VNSFKFDGPGVVNAIENVAKIFSGTHINVQDNPTNTPSPNQLGNLQLLDGKNWLMFSYGDTTLNCNLYLWDHSAKIVISDIDGTVTQSDVRGMVMPMLGIDWSHPMVCRLFTNIYS